MVPLVSSFMLSTKEGKKAWAEPLIDAAAPAIVAEGQRRRIYLSPNDEQARVAESAQPDWEPDGDLPNNPRDFKTPNYGMKTFASLFTPRQLVALTTFSDLVNEAREKGLADARATGLPPGARLADGGTGAEAYADALATYLAFCVSRASDYGSSVATWLTDDNAIRGTFGRQALPMTWDFCEGSYFGDSSASFTTIIRTVSAVIEHQKSTGFGSISNVDAPKNGYPIRPCVINTDPPYYDNIGYADLSDFFYIWLRRSLAPIWPDLFRRLTTPKAEELVATPYRHGGKESAEGFFMKGMGDALIAMRQAATDSEPLAIYYAFKQSEAAQDGVTSAGWSSFLQAVVDAGLVVDGTWPMRTESAGRLIGNKANALASSIVLVCRKRTADAKVITRADLVRLLRRELPEAIDDIRTAGVGPVDMQQSVIGPGMGVFSRHAKVLEDDDSAMPVKAALSLINRVWEEIDQELDAAFDAETQVALAWFATYGLDARQSGELITLANAKNIGTNALFESGVFKDLKGKTALTPREELPKAWTPAKDKSLTVWECVQHTARVLNAEDGGGTAAGRLVAEMGPKAAEARALAYRLFEIATQKGWAAEARTYNELAQEWPRLEDLASSDDVRATTTTAQAELF